MSFNAGDIDLQFDESALNDLFGGTEFDQFVADDAYMLPNSAPQLSLDDDLLGAYFPPPGRPPNSPILQAAPGPTPCPIDFLQNLMVDTLQEFPMALQQVPDSQYAVQHSYVTNSDMFPIDALQTIPEEQYVEQPLFAANSMIDPQLMAMEMNVPPINFDSPFWQGQLPSTPSNSRRTLRQTPKNSPRRTPGRTPKQTPRHREIVASPVSPDYFVPTVNISAPVSTARVGIMQKNIGRVPDTHVEYAVYKPLNAWSADGFRFSYSQRGYLQSNIIFTAESIKAYIYEHPLGDKLLLRVERQPYLFQCRYTDKSVSGCRAARCVVGKGKHQLKVGQFRVAFDELTRRLPADHDNDPYFAAGFIHLECLEAITSIPKLCRSGLVKVDDRTILPKEPEVTRENKMALKPGLRAVFEEFLQKCHQEPNWKPSVTERLSAKLWIANLRKSRPRGDIPAGLTEEDIAKQKQKKNPNWGGKRMAGLSVTQMNQMIAEGRLDEGVYPRNGKTGVTGAVTRKRINESEGFTTPVENSRQHNYFGVPPPRATASTPDYFGVPRPSDPPSSRTRSRYRIREEPPLAPAEPPPKPHKRATNTMKTPPKRGGLLLPSLNTNF
ncbi:hypothetical protein RUND412_009526 [Rhizina undulata]